MNARAETALRLDEKLRRELGPRILAWLADDEIIEIMLNSDGALWVERLGHQAERLGEMSGHQAEALMMTLASLKGQSSTTATRSSNASCRSMAAGFPAASRRSPPRPSTFAAARCASSRSRLCRRRRDDRRPIRLAGARHRRAAQHPHRRRHRLGQDHARQCADRPYCRAPARHRLVIIEDTPEIQCASPNAMIMQTSEHFDTRRGWRVHHAPQSEAHHRRRSARRRGAAR